MKSLQFISRPSFFSYILQKPLLSVSILNVCIFLGLFRLTNFNFYLSQFVGLPVEINRTGGNAFNFTNYLIPAVVLFYLICKGTALYTNWKSLWPYYSLITIYILGYIFSPFPVFSWLVYQLVFIGVALILHIATRKVSNHFTHRFKRGTSFVFWVGILFVLFCLYQIFAQQSLSTFFLNYNDAFNHSLDQYGIMKQRFGYLLGFLVSYAFFIIKDYRLKLVLLMMLVLAGLGIRSFILGFAGASILFSVKRPLLFLGFAVFGLVSYALVFKTYFANIIFDTRFYSYFNALQIIKAFPFGVGLGGYPVYTETFMSNLLADIYNVNAVQDYIPNAPESDIVHLLASLGAVLGGIHLLIQGRIVWLTYRFQSYLGPFEKCILYYFTFMTFYGISEDSIFSINYWVFFGISTGICSAYIYKKKKQTPL